MSDVHEVKILVVEDEAITAMDIETELSGLGYQVCGIADDQVSALLLFETERPELVLMDIRLAHGDNGIAIAAEMVEKRDVAIVFLTAHSDAGTLSRALSVSPLAYIVKPFGSRELRTTIEVAIDKHRKDMEIRELARRLKASEADLVAAKEALAELAVTDPLTGLKNRRGLDQALDREWRRGSRDTTPVGIIMVDVDHFKAFNDTYGHVAGDDCLRRVAAVLRDVATRGSDVVCRYGGEEFVILLPNTSDEGTGVVAERVVEGIRDLAIEHVHPGGGSVVTVSAGFVAARPWAADDPEHAMRQADDALYLAKRQGRDRAVTAG
jgi:two-component system chemotaxis family response regulator WspR